jgi:hypothetical protein
MIVVAILGVCILCTAVLLIALMRRPSLTTPAFPKVLERITLDGGERVVEVLQLGPGRYSYQRQRWSEADQTMVPDGHGGSYATWPEAERAGREDRGTRP